MSCGVWPAEPSLRIAMLCHSTNPRGGVAHALALGDALTDAGHEVTIFAPDAAGHGFGRPSRCALRPFAARAVEGDLRALVDVRAVEYRDALLDAGLESFDLLHAHDSLSGSVAADLIGAGFAVPFVRTVHHVDTFADAALEDRQARSIATAAAIVCPSRATALDVSRRFGRDATIVGNGVDPSRFSPTPGARDAAWRDELAGPGPRFLSVGGIEARKNSLRILDAFAVVLESRPDAQLLIAGGASLLDHSATRRGFADRLAVGGDALKHAVRLLGVLDDADLSAIYRCADALVFPSLHEGFGLAVLEAMASGVPAVVSERPPFTEYLAEPEAAWCDPLDVASIAEAMHRAVGDAASSYREHGRRVAMRHAWPAVAARHVPAYLAARRTGEASCPR